MIKRFSTVGPVYTSHSLFISIYCSQWSPLILPHKYIKVYLRMLPMDNTSASSYDLTKPLRTNSSSPLLNERVDNTREKSPVLPFPSGNQMVQSLPQLSIIQREPSRLRISSFNTTSSEPTSQYRHSIDEPFLFRYNDTLYFISSVLVDKYFPNRRHLPVI